ncbi:MAG: hypothetical protein H6919_09805 [Sphingomonadaceae bacterium]|nr:hypothetical protein [Sphingomonadaceae bacterium]
MLVALISARETTRQDDAGYISDLPAAGASIIARQLDVALSLGCERVVCLADGTRPSLVSLQRRAESAGARFILSPHHKALAGAVTSQDRLLVFADGVIAVQALAQVHFGKGDVILSLPADKAVPLGYERMDRERAWAGAMILRGSIVDKLNDLPPDIDCISSLLRLGLQSGVPIAAIDGEYLVSGDWSLVSEASQAEEFSRRRIKGAIARDSWLRPVNALADIATSQIALRSNAPGKVRIGTGFGAGLAIAGSFVASGFGHAIAGLGLVALGSYLLRSVNSLGQLVETRYFPDRAGKWVSRLSHLLLDLAILIAVIRALPGYVWIDGLFAATMLLGLLHLLPLARDELTVPLLSDRAILGIGLAIGAGAMVILPLTQMLALAAMAYGLVQILRLRLTQV